MDRNSFLAQQDVKDFIEWLCLNLPTLSVHLRVSRSRFVGLAIDQEVRGIEAVHALYQWGGDWNVVPAELRLLRVGLRLALRARDEQATHTACLAILKWGSVDGAIPFLGEQLKQRTLVHYLNACRPLLCLDSTQRLSELTNKSILRFDSGMTKIHSLLDTSGSPIYDGRVGA